MKFKTLLFIYCKFIFYVLQSHKIDNIDTIRDHLLVLFIEIKNHKLKLKKKNQNITETFGLFI